MLTLMYITNNPQIAVIAENAGVDRIFIDMEYIGKKERQGGMDTVQHQHTVEDVKRIRGVLHKAQLMVRVNPIHEATSEYCSSEDEIEAVIAAGADIVMLPYFQTTGEVRRFIECIRGRAKVLLLLESKKSYEQVDEILAIPGIDEIHVGINDLSLDLKKGFMFELLTDGTVETLCRKFREKGIPYGFGGVGRPGKGDIPAEYIIREHYRLGSSIAILSRCFCNTGEIRDPEEIERIFTQGLPEIRALEAACRQQNTDFEENLRMLKNAVQSVVKRRANS